MTTLFISDLHLDAGHPQIIHRFVEFTQSRAAAVDALYILGDLFETWIGDDAPDEHADRAIAALHALTAKGVACFVMHGNRDFLIGQSFCQRAGIELVSDPIILTVHGEDALVMHGDALCTDDRAYQILRAAVRDETWQRQFAALSVRQRRALGEAARAGSRTHTAALDYAIADVNQDSVVAAMRAARCALLIHGHTHRPGVHEFELDGQPAKRIVLGDWYQQGSVLRWDASGLELTFLPMS